jgi:hypothetical protein
LSLPDKSDPDGTDRGRSKGVRVLPAYFLKGIRERQIKIFKALNFSKIGSFGANNEKQFIPWLKGHISPDTTFNSSSRHCCHFYNPTAVPTNDAYESLNSLCTFLTGVQSNYGTNLREKRGDDFSELQRLESAAKSAAGKIGGKIGGKKAVERFALKNNAGKVLALFKCSGCAELKERPSLRGS